MPHGTGADELRQAARQCLRDGRLEQAAAFYEQLLAANSGDLDAMEALLGIYARQGRADDLFAGLQRLVNADPGNLRACIELAKRLQERGRLDEAREVIRHALTLAPESAELFGMLARGRSYREYDDEVAAMERLYAKAQPGGKDRKQLAFALGKVYDDLGRYDDAFACFADGNRIANREYGERADAFAARNRHVSYVFDADFLRRHAGAGIDDPGVILVTGMARSGTTLVESILAAHGRVFGAGEAMLIGPAMRGMFADAGLQFPGGALSLTDDMITKAARGYVDALRARAQGLPHVVDKNLGMEPYLGLFAVMLPRARIILCERDPRDQGLSFFQKDFGRQQTVSYDLANIASYIRQYRFMMNHWQKIIADRVFTVRYEDLVADPENNIRRLLEYCDLDFDPACYRFHETDRVVRTESLAQVRRPIHNGAIGRWKNYAAHLGPLIDGLDGI